MRPTKLLCLVTAALSLEAGCHLIYPFDVLRNDGDGTIADPDGNVVDAGPVDAPGDGAEASDLLPADGPPLDLPPWPDSDGGGVYKWSKTGGSASFSDEAFDVVVTSSGAVCVTGRFYSSINLGGSTFTSIGSSDIFLACYDASGTHQWSKAFGSSGVDSGRALATNGGKLCLAGVAGGAVGFGGVPVGGAGGSDAAVACFGLNGNHLWSRGYGDASAQQARGIAVDSAGNTTVTGFFHGSVTFDTKVLSSKGGADIFLVQLDSSGNHNWSQAFGSGGDDYGRSVAVSTSGGLALVGDFENTINLGGSNLTSVASSEVFVARYTSSGTHGWSKSFEGSGIDLAHDVVQSGAGALYVTGSFTGAITIGGDKHTGKGMSDAFVAALTSTGSVSWSEAIGGAGADVGYSVAVSSGVVRTTGAFQSTVSLGSQTHINRGQDDVLVVSHNASGSPQSLHGFGGPGVDRGFGIAASSAGIVYVTGAFSGTVDFGGGPVTSGGLADVFLLALSP